MPRLAVIDFETTGLSPGNGDRATEVAIVLVEGARVVDRFQSLMNAGVRIPAFITGLTGISNAMIASAPAAAQVMREASRFVGQAPLAAPQPFICTLLLARRLYPQAPSHQLGALVDFHSLPRTGQAHRALADAEMAAALLARMAHDLRTLYGVALPDHALLMALQGCAKSSVGALVAKYAST